MLIHEVSTHTGVLPTTIRYYEAVGLLPPAQRGPNNYRSYTLADIDRLRLIAGARSLGISLRDIATVLAARDADQPPCGQLLTLLTEQLGTLERRIAELLSLRATLRDLAEQGATLPQDDVAGQHCICALLKTYSMLRGRNEEVHLGS